MGTITNTNVSLATYAALSFGFMINFSNPFNTNDPGTSPGCTLADTNMYFFLNLKI